MEPKKPRTAQEYIKDEFSPKSIKRKKMLSAGQIVTPENMEKCGFEKVNGLFKNNEYIFRLEKDGSSYVVRDLKSVSNNTFEDLIKFIQNKLG